MNIRAKLAWTFILLLIFGITAISSYSILFIRNYLIEEGVKEMRRDATWMGLTFEDMSEEAITNQALAQIAEASGYQLAIYDTAGVMVNSYTANEVAFASAYLADSLRQQVQAETEPVIVSRDEPEIILAFTRIGDHIVQLSQYRERMYEPITTIRWIIYSGMFISIGIVIVVSMWFARYISKPILQLKEAALRIASGNTEESIKLDRSDEFGTLAQSLNRMASRLRDDARELQKANERQRQFFADITHEIRNPLHTIMGSLEMLEAGLPDEEKREKYIANAHGQAERIHRLFKDLMSLQRYDSDEYYIQRKVFDLSELTVRLYDLYEDLAQTKGLRLNIDQHEQLVVGDPDKMEQVLENLISNALKYTSKGRIEVHYQLIEPDNEVEIEVEDTGIGIAESHLDRLFDRFYRTDTARSRDKGGVGLGLSVVKSILDAHDSKIEVLSNIEQGTTFRFRLPAEQ
ncbi:MAG: sensor histidine kinase [Bacteroidota bacterium]